MPNSPQRSETILLVEDQDAVRNVTAEYLVNAGFRVLTAQSGTEALELMRDGRAEVDLLLTDVVMPDLSGPELAEALSAVRPGLRVLYLSGYAQDIVSPDGTLPERSAFLQKPFPLGSLVREVRALLDAPR
jgi:CheY-like chemotaxis protein